MNKVIKTNTNEIERSNVMRELQRVQAQVILSKKFPRDRKEVVNKIEKACTSVELAGQAMYEYKRGGMQITGPSIKLLEVIAQCYGNIDCGVVELDQDEGESTFQAFAWDMESNMRIEKTFTVKHIRYTKNGTKELTDPRDIYETVANNGSRRLRSCLQSVIPKDIVQAAIDEVAKTLKAKVQVTPERLKKMIEGFEIFKISKEDIEDYIGSRLESITPSMFLKLNRIYKSLEDEMASKEDFFKSKSDANTETIIIPEGKEEPDHTKTKRLTMPSAGQSTLEIENEPEKKKKESNAIIDEETGLEF